MQIRVYVCPTEGCGSYYGSSGMGELDEKIVGQYGQNFERRPVEMHHSRAQCPECRARGNKVERVAVLFDFDTPSPAVLLGVLTPPELPAVAGE